MHFGRFRRHLDISDKIEEIEEAVQPRLYLLLIVVALVVAYVIAFAIENSKPINVHFVFATAKVSVSWMILVSLAAGLVTGVALSQLHRHRQRRRLAKKQRQTLDAGGDLGGGGEAVGESR